MLSEACDVDNNFKFEVFPCPHSWQYFSPPGTLLFFTFLVVSLGHAFFLGRVWAVGERRLVGVFLVS